MKRNSTILICVGLFFFFLVVRFPFQNLRGFIFTKIYKQTGVLIVSEDMYLTLFGWPGVGLRNVTATLPPQILGDELEIAAHKITIRVGVGSLLPPSLSYSIYVGGMKKGGDLFIKLSRLEMKGQQLVSLSSYFDADGVHLEQLGFGSGPSDTLTGVATGDGSFTIDFTDLSKTSGSLRLSIEKLRSPGANLQGIVIPPIRFGTLQAKLGGKAGSMEISKLEWGGGESDMQGSLTGDLRLGRDIYQSFLNLTALKLKMTDKFRDDPNSATIVSTLNSVDNRTPGTYALKWTQGIDKIAQNFLYALPEKLN